MGFRERVEAVARQVILRHGGEINQFVGDGIMAVFGLNTPEEEPVRYAIEASLDLHEAIRGAGWKAPGARGFEIRFHSGVVFAKSGDPLSGKYELTGDCVNTAARLCSAAGRDEVLVSAAALRGFESFFEVEPVHPLALKGKQHPVHCLRVKGRSRVQTRFEARSLGRVTPFVGRQEILTLIERRLEEATHSSPRALCVRGDAGIGKTRLFDELTRRAVASGHVVRRGSCENYGGVVPLRPFLQIANDVLPVVAGLDALLAAWLGNLLAYWRLDAVEVGARGEVGLELGAGELSGVQSLDLSFAPGAGVRGPVRGHRSRLRAVSHVIRGSVPSG